MRIPVGIPYGNGNRFWATDRNVTGNDQRAVSWDVTVVCPLVELYVEPATQEEMATERKL